MVVQHALTGVVSLPNNRSKKKARTRGPGRPQSIRGRARGGVVPILNRFDRLTKNLTRNSSMGEIQPKSWEEANITMDHEENNEFVFSAPTDMQDQCK